MTATGVAATDLSPIDTGEVPLTVAEYHDRARARLQPVYYDFLAGGAGDEITLRDNETRSRADGCCPGCFVVPTTAGWT
jgi:hypothetical protein